MLLFQSQSEVQHIFYLQQTKSKIFFKNVTVVVLCIGFYGCCTFGIIVNDYCFQISIKVEEEEEDISHS